VKHLIPNVLVTGFYNVQATSDAIRGFWICPDFGWSKFYHSPEGSRVNIDIKQKNPRGHGYQTTNRPAWGNFDPILGIFDRTIFSYFSKYQCLPKTVKSFILHLHFFDQYYSVLLCIHLVTFKGEEVVA
jgi:hypothetical protein